jgi:hypothetical protein
MLCANNLRINNTFFHHKPQHKYTWENTRGYRSTIDYILTNKNIYPSQILDVRSMTIAETGSDHRLVPGKLRLKLKCKQRIEKNKNLELIQNHFKMNLPKTYTEGDFN